MNLFEQILEGAKISAKVTQKKYGPIIFHVFALFGYVFSMAMLPNTSIEFKIVSLLVTFLIGQTGVSFANSVK